MGAAPRKLPNALPDMHVLLSLVLVVASARPPLASSFPYADVPPMIAMRPPRRALLPFIAVALASLALSACAKKQERQQRPLATVGVVPARRATVPYVI